MKGQSEGVGRLVEQREGKGRERKSGVRLVTVELRITEKKDRQEMWL